MRIDLTVCGVDGVDHDVAVLAPAPVPFTEIVPALRAALGPSGTAAGWCSGARPLGHSDVLGGPGLRCGDRLTPIPTAGEPNVRKLTVVGGIDAGTSLAGSRRTVVIGRGEHCTLRLRDPDVSRRHAELTFTTAGVLVRDLGSTHGTELDGTRVTERMLWERAQWLRVGDTHLALSAEHGTPAHVRATRAGRLEVRPRLADPPAPPPEFEAPPAPRRSLRIAGGWSSVLVPALAGAGFALWTGSVAFLALAMLSPLALLATTATGRLGGRRRARRRDEQAAATISRFEAELAQALRDETAARRRRSPDAASLLAIARGPLDRLWQRGRGPDLLHVRLGLTDVDADVRVSRSGRVESGGVLTAVPAVIDLAAGPLGLVGPRETVRAIARWLIAQLAVLASPADVRIEVRAQDEGPWSWLRWLPHVSSAVDGTGDDGGPAVVRVHDGDSPADPGCRAAIYLVENRADLPAGCTQVVTVANESGTRLHFGGRRILTDAVDVRWADRIARAIAPLSPARTAGSAMPRSCRLSDVLGPATTESVAGQWRSSNGGAVAAIGVGAQGPLEIDLDRHGPHALIAGTTGAGKSQLLRTLVAALATRHPPEDLALVLVDYKGGAAFAECAALPHVVGVVTDLDEHLTSRALASLHSELRRRERLFAAAGAGDLAEYRAAATGPPVARLVIVVDEFATLAKELPDFVAGLTGIAQRGRSLGLHLVLATQRPAGAVTADVRANCSLRIALRVTDVGDSQDVIDGPQAATIAHDLPGRAFVWVDGAAQPVQVARSDLPARADPHRGVEVQRLGPWRSLEVSEPAVLPQQSELAAIVAAVCLAAAGRSAAPAPWLPPLPDRLPLDAVPAPPHRGTAAVGVVDLPSTQTQQSLVLDLSAGCSLVLAGAPRSGRTSALITIALAAAARNEPDELHIHAIDMGGDLGAALDGLPHCGTLATPGAGLELVDALLRELAAEGDEKTPWLLLVDGWDAFVRAGEPWDGGGCVERLLSLIRAGGRGRTIAVAGDRSVLAPRLAAAVTTRLLFRQPDRTDHTLAGIPLAAVPKRMPAGRVLLAPDGTEAQFAHAGCEPSPAAARAAVTARAARTTRPSTALRLRALPATVGVADLPPPDATAAFAVAAPRCHPVAVPMTGPTRLLIAGPARSGRSTTLLTLLHQAVLAGHPVSVVAPARSPVRAAADRLRIPAVDPGADSTDVAGAGVLLVDDSEELTDSALDDALAHEARHRAAPLLVSARIEDAARAYRGLIAEMKRTRCALLLQPGPLDGELVGIRLPAGWTGGLPGRGVLLGDPCWGVEDAADPLRVQVASTP